MTTVMFFLVGAWFFALIPSSLIAANPSLFTTRRERWLWRLAWLHVISVAIVLVMGAWLHGGE